MFCANCGKEISDQAKFCGFCGHPTPTENVNPETEVKDASGNVIGPDIPLHISRFFPRFHMTDRPATNVKHIYRLADIARERLRYVYTGNC